MEAIQLISGSLVLTTIIATLSVRNIILLSSKLAGRPLDTARYFNVIGGIVIGLGLWAVSYIVALTHEHSHYVGHNISTYLTTFTLALFSTIAITLPKNKRLLTVPICGTISGLFYISMHVINIQSATDGIVTSVDYILFCAGSVLIFSSYLFLSHLRLGPSPLVSSSIAKTVLIALTVVFGTVLLSAAFGPVSTTSAVVVKNKLNIYNLKLPLSIVVMVVLAALATYLGTNRQLRASLSLKITTMILAMFVLAVVVVGITLNTLIENIKRDDNLRLAINTIRFDHEKFQLINSKIADDLLLFAQHQDVVSFMSGDGSSLDRKLRVTDLFKKYMKSNDYVLQLRLISSIKHGQEMVRVQRFIGEVFMFADAELQNKGSTGYYKTASTLGPGEIYVSNANLNREHGRIQFPYTPTYRIATPIYYKNEVRGIVIINMDFKKVVNVSKSSEDASVARYIVDELGNYLVHPDKSKEFSFEEGNVNNLKNYIPEASTILDSGIMEIAPKIVDIGKRKITYFAYKIPFLPNSNSPWLVYIGVIDNQSLENTRNTMLIHFVQVSSVFGFIAVFLIVALSQYIINPLKNLSNAYSLFITDRKIGKLEVGQDDEMGDLTKSFGELCGSVEQNEAKLTEKTEFLDTILHNIYDGIIVIDELGIVHSMNKAAEKMFLRKKEDIVGRNVSELLPAPHRENHDKYIQNYIRTGHGKIIGVGREVEAYRADNKKIDIELGITELTQGNVRFFVGTLKDVTQRKVVENELRSRQHELSAILEAAVDGILTIDGEGKILAVNPAVVKMLGYTKTELLSVTIGILLPTFEISAFTRGHISAENTGREYSAVMKNGSSIPVELSVSEADIDGRLLYIGIMRDISERKKQDDELKLTLELLQESKSQLLKSNRELENASKSDPLTQIANRRYFEEAFDSEFKRARRNRTNFGIMMIDVDYFKLYNDTYGHQQGDACLKSVARVIREMLKRPADVAARYGGEEFIVLMPETDREGLIIVAEGLLHTIRALNIAHESSPGEKIVTISVGAYLASPERDVVPAEIINRADMALYEAKTRGRNRIIFKYSDADQIN